MNENKVEVGESSLPESWQMVRIDEIGEVVTGTTPKTSKDEYYGGEIPFVRPAELGSGRRPDRTEKTLTSEGLNVARPLPPGSVLVSCIGLLGKVAQANKISATNQQINAVIPGYKVDQGFAYWVLHLARVKMKRLAGLQVVPIVNKTQFSGIELPVPPIAEQRRIADVLDTVDAAIRETDAVIAKQEQVKTGLLQDLLTRGLDTNGRLRDPEANPGAFRETEIGRLPQEWKVYTLEILLTRFRNGSSTKQIRQPTPYPVARIETIASGEVDYSSVRYHRKEQPDFRMQLGDILYSHINSTNHIGKVALYKARKPLYHGMNLLILRPDEKIIYPRLLYKILASGRGRAYARREARPAVNQESLTQGAVGGFPVQVPPKEEQRRVLRRMDIEQSYVNAERQYRSKLQTLKTGLMQDLLTGRVRVPEAEERIQQVTR